ncbi:MAG: methylated-DNA--[Clostridia bacterium]|nr:methylated-DNA--[protein]-cysteine S-methyltransferase [Clostridia bacterium]
MHTCYIHIRNTPVGDITVTEHGGCITGLTFDMSCPGQCRRTALLDLCESQLMEYFRGERRRFDLPIYMEDTAFRQKVWKALMDIPYGETITYGELAKMIGSPNSARAAGSACGANPLLIIVPCHRVVGRKGLTGYAGGLDSKKTLLKIEKSGK